MPIYNPTTEEIAAECLKIQAGWDLTTERSRRVYAPNQDVTIKVCRVSPSLSLAHTPSEDAPINSAKVSTSKI